MMSKALRFVDVFVSLSKKTCKDLPKTQSWIILNKL